jgi:hypothetical protein
LPIDRLSHGEPNTPDFVIKKLPPPTRTSVKGGCSPQNNHGKGSKTDASQVCLGNTGLYRLCYVEFTYSRVSQTDTLSVVPNAGNVIDTREPKGDLTEWRRG